MDIVKDTLRNYLFKEGTGVLINSPVLITTSKQYEESLSKIPLCRINTTKHIKKERDNLFIDGVAHSILDFKIGDMLRLLIANDVDCSIIDSHVCCNLPVYHIMDFSNKVSKSIKIQESPLNLEYISVDNHNIHTGQKTLSYTIIDRNGEDVVNDIIGTNVFTNLGVDTYLIVTQTATDFDLYFVLDVAYTDSSKILNAGGFINVS